MAGEKSFVQCPTSKCCAAVEMNEVPKHVVDSVESMVEISKSKDLSN